jgi:hypothetical protein
MRGMDKEDQAVAAQMLEPLMTHPDCFEVPCDFGDRLRR